MKKKENHQSKWKAYAVNMGLLIGVLLLMFLVLEAVARIFIEPPPYSEKGWYQLSENAVLGYEHTPSKSGIYQGYDASVNEEGRRDRHNKSALKGITVAFVGDSFTFGQGVDQEHTLPQRFEEFYQQASGTKVNALNFGIGGYNLEQEVELIRTKVLDYPVSRIYLVWYINDIELSINAAQELNAQSRLPLHLKAYNILISSSRFAAFMKFKLSGIAYRAGWTNKGYVQYYYQLYAPETAAWKKFDTHLSLLAQIQKERNITITIVLYPTLSYLNEHHPYLGLYEYIVNASNAHDIEAINLFEAFRGKDARSLRANMYDNHPNADAQEIAAQFLAEKALESL